jgi:isochorismate pyruvate lyase
VKIKKCRDLNDVRKNIDRLDEKIIKLISKRSGFVKQAGCFKTSEEGVKDTGRVEQVLDKITGLAVRHHMNPEIAREIYRTMINCFVNMELEEFRSDSSGA